MVAALSRLLGRKKPAAAEYASRAPAGARIYAIGDIHGRLDLLERLRSRILDDSSSVPQMRKVLVYLGDYIDRGMQSREVIDLLLDRPLAGFDEVHLRGNHEQAMLEFLEDASGGIAWVQFGGGVTLHGYDVHLPPGLMTPQALLSAQRSLQNQLPPSHLAFLRGLAWSHIEGDYLFVHAGIRPGVPLRQQNPADLIWIRDEFLSSSVDHGKVVVHGHTISDDVEMRANRIGIDTGAYFSGRLSCLVLEGTSRRLLQT